MLTAISFVKQQSAKLELNKRYQIVISRLLENPKVVCFDDMKVVVDDVAD